ncbi:MAG: hypothetical protein COT90_05415 [Candidatus Diapherotrites archaeon CG10_big_fil_rev_8_21_14_0_10_31_34]|nr:MAG: hypothetical protein COT90_05415 [Candidatus Diapherotrites archaeon CG10_big_fil_rev_8_21_14_0_10_31_34]
MPLKTRQLLSRTTRFKKNLITSNRRNTRNSAKPIFARQVKRKISEIKDLDLHSNMKRLGITAEKTLYDKILFLEKIIKRNLKVKSNSLLGFGKKRKYYFVKVYSPGQTTKLLRIINTETVSKLMGIEREITTKIQQQKDKEKKQIIEGLQGHGPIDIFPFSD